MFPRIVLLVCVGLSRQAQVGEKFEPAPIGRAHTELVPDRLFDAIAKDYIRQYWDSHPLKAAEAGLHQYDGRAPDFSGAGIERWLAYNKETLAKLAKVDHSELSPSRQVDHQILRFACGKAIFELQDLAVHKANPDFYNKISEGLLNYIRRDYAPLEVRLRRAIELLAAVSGVFEQAKVNLNETLPNPYVETAVENIEGSIAFFHNDLVAAFAEVQDEKLQSELRKSANAAAQATSRFVQFLKEEKQPKADDKFALGPEKFQRMLKLTEGIDMPLQQLLAIGEKDLRRNLDRVQEIANNHFGGISPAELMKKMSSNTYAAQELIPQIASGLEAIRQFLIDGKIITVPSPLRPLVTETPPFMRWGFAFLTAPGPYEILADQVYYDVTPVEPHWTAQEKREWLEVFNKYVATNTSVHEAYPGHFVEYLHTRNAPSDVQKIFRSYAAEEGWAHYCEEMMIEQGWASGDPMYEVGMLQDALLRNCRFICSVRMHCFGMTLEQATQFFMENAFYGRLPAYKEAIRGTFDPGYLKYTLGKLQILKLRDDYRKKVGQEFTLRKFHDELLSHGMPPLIVTRQWLLGAETSREP